MTRLTDFSKVTATGTYGFFLATLFVTELALMETGSTYFSRLSRLSAALLDASILVIVFAVPFFIFCMRLRSEETGNRRAFMKFFLPVMGAIFLIEASVMLILPSFVPPGKPHLGGLIDAALTMLLSALPLWWMLRRLERRYRRVPLGDYLNSPPMLYCLLLFMIFLADLQKELILPLFGDEPNTLSYKTFSSLLTTIFIAPVIWLLVARPLKRSALAEKARTKAVYDQVIDAVITFDADGMIDCFNPGAQRIFGYTAEAMIGQPVSRVFEDGEQAYGRLIRSAVRSSSSSLSSSELICCRVDGTRVTMDVSISRMLLQGVSEFLLIMRDISERRMAAEALQFSETRFRQIFEQTDDAIVFIHPRNYSVIDINKTMGDMFGHDRSVLVAEGLQLLWPAETQQRFMESIIRLKPGQTSQLDNLVGRGRDGTEIILSMRVKNTILGNVEIIYCTLRDITDRVRMEAEAQEIQSKLIQASKMTALGLMVSGVAHEINNPNNYILANAQLLERSWQDASKVLREYARDNGDFLLGGIPYSKLEEQSPQLFAGIVDGSRRINAIVTNLKGFARQESVSLENEVDVNQIANAAISILHHEISRFTGHFRFEPAEDLPRIRGNRQQLGQVVVNLLMNACQALPDKTCGVWLRTWLDPDAGHVVLSVQDEGCGMLAEDSKSVMEPFFTTKLDSGGTGLGLSICRTIIKDHQGVLDFNSEYGKGTTFFIRLPVMEAATEDVNL